MSSPTADPTGRLNLLLPVVFPGIWLGHFAWTSRAVASGGSSAGFAAYDFAVPAEPPLGVYVEAGVYWLGASYAVAGTFALWCLLRMIRLRRSSLVGPAGGLTLGGVLWVGVCFLTGCCGSPMLPLYVGLLGPRFAGATRPLTFVVTLLSVAVGYAWMRRFTPKGTPPDVDARLHEAAGAHAGSL